MRIAVIGTGKVGSTLGGRWARKGHEVTFGSRTPQSQKVTELLNRVGGNASAVSIKEAVSACDVIVLAISWSVAEQVIKSADSWAGKILVDCTNPIAPGLQLSIGTTTSAGEQVAGWAEGAKVVKAFNTTGVENMADPIYDGQSTTMFICGDDENAKATVAELSEQLGFDVADTGPLAASRFLEPLAMVWIRLATTQGLGRNIAFKLMKR